MPVKHWTLSLINETFHFAAVLLGSSFLGISSLLLLLYVIFLLPLLWPGYSLFESFWWLPTALGKSSSFTPTICDGIVPCAFHEDT